MFLMHRRPLGSTARTQRSCMFYGRGYVAVTLAFSSQAGEEGGVDAITTFGASKWRGSRRDSTASNPRRSIKRTVQATIWGMSSPATSVKRMFRPL
jgi:hypothetical protein